MDDASGVEEMIVLPIKKTILLNGLMFCIQCNKLFVELEDTKDHGICSLSCGYAFRGLHWSDFI